MIYSTLREKVHTDLYFYSFHLIQVIDSQYKFENIIILGKLHVCQNALNQKILNFQSLWDFKIIQRFKVERGTD